MGDQSGRINSTRDRVDHVASDNYWFWYLLCLKGLCVLSRYLSCYILKVYVCCLDILKVCVCVVSISQPSSRYLDCVVSISQPNSRGLDYPLWVHAPKRRKKMYKEKRKRKLTGRIVCENIAENILIGWALMTKTKM